MHPRVGVGVILFNEKSEILVGKRKGARRRSVGASRRRSRVGRNVSRVRFERNARRSRHRFTPRNDERIGERVFAARRRRREGHISRVRMPDRREKPLDHSVRAFLRRGRFTRARADDGTTQMRGVVLEETFRYRWTDVCAIEVPVGEREVGEARTPFTFFW